MPTMQGVGERLRQRFVTTTGRKFYGYMWTSQMRNLPDTSFVLPRRFIRIAGTPIVNAGDVIDTISGIKYLLALDRPEEYRDELVSTTFRMFEMDLNLAWTRNATTNDAVTNLAKKTGTTALGNIWCSLELLRMEEDQSIKKRVYRVITGADIQVGDLIGGKVVRNVETQLGVCIGEAV